MKHLDLFSGIGGFALAARSVGWETIGFCEIDPYCQKVLRKHWPDVPIYEDVRELPYDSIGPVSVITGGYPCQGESLAGKRLGADDDRWLGEVFTEVVGTLKPRFVVGENVAGHITLGLDKVLSDLEALGYTCWPIVIPACAVDAYHRRDRVWVLGYANDKGESIGSIYDETSKLSSFSANTSGEGLYQRELQRRVSGQEERERQGKAAKLGGKASSGQVLADTSSRRQSGSGKPIKSVDTTQSKDWEATEFINGGIGAKWSPEPTVGRVANGIPRELDLYRGLIFEQGNHKETDAEALRQYRGRLLRAMWEYREVAKTSPDVYAQRLRDSLPEVPHEDSHGGWYLGAWIEKSEELYDLWQAFYSKPLEEAQDLQQKLLERVRKIERTKEVGPTKNRADRLRGLGNAIVPQVAEMIFRAINEVEVGIGEI